MLTLEVLCRDPRGTLAGPFLLAVLDRAGDTFGLGQILGEHATLAELAPQPAPTVAPRSRAPRSPACWP